MKVILLLAGIYLLIFYQSAKIKKSAEVFKPSLSKDTDIESRAMYRPTPEFTMSVSATPKTTVTRKRKQITQPAPATYKFSVREKQNGGELTYPIFYFQPPQKAR